MKRFTLLLVLILIVVVTSATQLIIEKTDGTQHPFEIDQIQNITFNNNSQVILYDDFESYDLDTFPSSGGWVAQFNGAGDSEQYVTNQYSFEGEKSFRLHGVSSWDARIIKELSSTPSVVYYEVSFYSESVSEEGAFSLYNPSIGTWGAGMFGVNFTNGTITFPTGVEVDYIPQQWYTVKVKANLASDEMSAWLNGVQYLDNAEYDVPAYPYTHFQMTATNDGSNIVFYDKVKVWTE